MNGLLQRLAIQALGAQATNAPPRIRAAASVHAAAPVATAKVDDTTPASRAPLAAGEGLDTGPREQEAPPGSQRETEARSIRETLREIQVPRPLANMSAPAPSRAPIVTATAPTAKLKFDGAAASLPAALLPEAPSSPAQPVMNIKPIPAPPLAIAPVRAQSEATEVHVHIGRIEVTASQESAPTARPRKAARPTRPLSDYLVRRSQS
jgi:hypothetical protein